MVHLKSDSEIEKLRASAHLVGRTLAEVGKHVQPGVTTAELDAIAEDYVRSHGAVPAFKGYQPGRGYTPFPGTLCTSVNDEVVHGFPRDEPLEDGDLVSIDCGVLLDGYYGDSAFTFAVGTLDPADTELCRTTYEALYLGIEQAIAGRRVGDIANAVQRHCEGHGYGVVYDLVGHGIGRSLHEEPQVPNFGRPGKGRKLRSGLTICIEPMINRGTADVTVDDDGWTIRTADGLASAHYEHMVVVRKGQAEILSTFDYIEEVVQAPYREPEPQG